MSPLRAGGIAAGTVLALGLGACGGGSEPLPREAGSDPLALRAVQAGPGAAIMSVHWIGRSCSETGVEPDEEDPGEIVVTLDQPRTARCRGVRSAQTISLPLERDVGARRIIDARTKNVLPLATCRAPGDVPKAIKRSICRLESRGRRRQ
ncbi:MAG: hypothetical protein M3131_05270 [Actinomycetota bacterium]|nr:hypothetical protein [Actinomycetota bacterium]